MDTLPHLSGQPGNDTACPEVAAVISTTRKMISMRRTDPNSCMVAGKTGPGQLNHCQMPPWMNHLREKHPKAMVEASNPEIRFGDLFPSPLINETAYHTHRSNHLPAITQEFRCPVVLWWQQLSPSQGR